MHEMVVNQESWCKDHPDDIEAAIELNALREQENFAWQDDEAEMEGY